MKYTELFSQALLNQMISEGYIAARENRAENLWLYSYTDKAAYDHVWNAATRNCRGLVVDAQDNIVARPFAKFFGIGEVEAPVFDADQLVEVSDKRDGSLIIVFYAPSGKWIAASRGSFSSPQAIHAQGLLHTVAHRLRDISRTYLFEGCWPTNRIVLDYGDFDGLFFLGAIETETGFQCESADDAVVTTYAEVLSRSPRPNAEGYVLRAMAGEAQGDRLKIKQEDYKALHRIITQCTARMLWEFLSVNDLILTGFTEKQIGNTIGLSAARVAEIVAVGPKWKQLYTGTKIPPAFAKWVDARSSELNRAVADRLLRIRKVYELTSAQIALGGISRKELALRWNEDEDRGALFGMLDGRSAAPHAWKMAYPAHELPFASNE